MLNLLAFDLGASNGRAILGQLENGKITMKELHRFENNYYEKDGAFYWDLPYLFDNLKKGTTFVVPFQGVVYEETFSLFN